MLSAIIVDDEARGRRTLETMVTEYCPSVKVVALAEDVLSAVKAINLHKPDIVFLDIEMPNYSGFKLLELFEEITFDVVFTTAYEQYAIRAFKVDAAAGYLLKPIDIDELIEIVKRIEGMRSTVKTIETQPSPIPASPNNSNRTMFPAQSGVLYLNIDEINHLESDGRYTNIFLVDGSKVLTTYSLKECEQKLRHDTFIRVHRSFIINLAFIKKYARGRDSFIQMENGAKVDVGKNYKDDLIEAVSYFIK